MNKSELAAKIAKDTKISKSAAENAINSFTSNIKSALKKNQSVTLIGFGTFSTVKRKARKGRNPQTGRSINIPAKKVPKFKAGKGLKDSIK